MREFENKRRLKRILYSRVAIVMLAIIVILLARSTWHIYSKERESARKRSLTHSELEELKDREKKLSTDVNNLKSSQGIEREIREKYRMVKEGEELVVIIDDNSTTTEEAASKKWWQFWRRD